MNIKMLKAALAGLVLSVSGFANAGLINSDYLNLNDNLAVHDDVQNLTWLDLSVSSGWTNNTWSSLIQQNSGWRLALNSEIESLFNQAFPTFYNIYPANTNYVDATDSGLVANFNDFQNLFGVHSFLSNSITNTYGRYIDEDGIHRLMGVSGWNNTNRIWGLEASSTYSLSSNDGMGIYLVREDAESVPEPSTLAIFALAIMGLASRRFKKQ
jgi:hypothetical protein